VGFQAAAVALACAALVLSVAGRRTWSRHPDYAAAQDRLEDDLDRIVRENGMAAPRIAVNQVSEYLNYKIFSIRRYERDGRWLDYHQRLGLSIFGIKTGDILDALRQSEFVILTDRPVDRAMFYPAHRSLAAAHAEMLAYCRRHLYPVGEYQVFQDRLLVFMAPTLKLTGPSAGWVTSEGLTLEGRADLLRRYPVLELTGTFLPQHLPDPGPVTVEVLRPGQTPRQLTAEVETSGRNYRIHCRLTGIEGTDDVVSLRVRFGGYFVPAERGMNDDTRRLVVQTPRVRLLP
jgi:hypothetical protein